MSGIVEKKQIGREIILITARNTVTEARGGILGKQRKKQLTVSDKAGDGFPEERILEVGLQG